MFLTGLGKPPLNILLGNSSGFDPALNYDSSGGALTAGDFNRDGKQDLAIVSSGRILLLLGRNDGSFQTPVDIAATDASDIVAGDVNRDGILRLCQRRQ